MSRFFASSLSLSLAAATTAGCAVAPAERYGAADAPGLGLPVDTGAWDTGDLALPVEIDEGRPVPPPDPATPAEPADAPAAEDVSPPPPDPAGASTRDDEGSGRWRGFEAVACGDIQSAHHVVVTSTRGAVQFLQASDAPVTCDDLREGVRARHLALLEHPTLSGDAGRCQRSRSAFEGQSELNAAAGRIGACTVFFERSGDEWRGYADLWEPDRYAVMAEALGDCSTVPDGGYSARHQEAWSAAYVDIPYGHFIRVSTQSVEARNNRTVVAAEGLLSEIYAPGFARSHDMAFAFEAERCEIDVTDLW